MGDRWHLLVARLDRWRDSPPCDLPPPAPLFFASLLVGVTTIFEPVRRASYTDPPRDPWRSQGSLRSDPGRIS